MTTIKAVNVIISGKVQGVFYRASTHQTATRLNVKGWVRNLPNGCVEAVFEADENVVRKMIDWCRKGPSAAAVTHVEINTCTVENFDSFNIRY